MREIFKRELRMNLKNLLIWSLTVGGMGLACTLLYSSMEGEMKTMADAFSQMGAFSDAFGMSTLSIATLKGYFATEVGTIQGLGGGMFAAILATGILSKEEEGHTGEFLMSLPVSRSAVVAAKYLTVLVNTIAFSAICTGLYLLGFAILGEEMPMGDFFRFMLMQLILSVEIGGICFMISSISGKNRMGLGLGITLFFYFYDIIGRVVPDLKDSLYVGPYSYANASEIFSGAEANTAGIVTGVVILAACTVSSFVIYKKRDLAF